MATSYNNSNLSVYIDGFAEAPSYMGDENDFVGVTTSKDAGGTVVVENDYNFTVDDHQVKISNVAGGAVAFTYGSKGGNINLDLSELTAVNGKTINVSSAADAETLVPPAAEQQIKIGNNTYSYTNFGEAYFMLNASGAATGFVLADTDDSVTVSKNQTLAVYDADDTENEIANVTGTGYAIIKNENDYTITITKTASVAVGDATLDFTIQTDLTNNPIAITFEDDGTITNVANLDKLVSTSDNLVVNGEANYKLPVGNETISTASGNFTLVGGTAQQLAISFGDTVNSVYSGVKVIVGPNGGAGDDKISSKVSNISINGKAGNDTIDNSGANVSIDGSDGKDEIYNSGSNSTITSGSGNDSIFNYAEKVTINANSFDDYIFNSGANVSIDGGDGNDSIDNRNSNVSINGGSDNDSIRSEGRSVKIDASAGNDSIYNIGSQVTIDGGDGNDSINNGGYNVTINGGGGNDYVENHIDNVRQ